MAIANHGAQPSVVASPVVIREWLIEIFEQSQLERFKLNPSADARFSLLGW
jgi:hypothetical protein